MNKNESDRVKKPRFPREDVIDKQLEESAKKLGLKRMVVKTHLRAGEARYGLPKTYSCES